MKLYIQNPVTPFSSYMISGPDQALRYTVSSDANANCCLLYMQDSAGRQIGLVNVETLSYDSVIRMGVDGSMHDTIWLRKTPLELKIDCFGWKIQGDPVHSNYVICAGKNPIIETSRSLNPEPAVDTLNIADNQDERLAVMLVIAIGIALRNRA